MTDNDSTATRDTESQAADAPQAAPGASQEAADETAETALPSAGELKRQAEDNWARYMRTAAELDNLRKRSTRDLEHARKYGHEKFAAEMLTVKDSLELGLAAAKENADKESSGVESLVEGTEMTLKMMEQALAKFGVEAVQPLDQPFNPELHEAMAMLEAPNVAPNTVLQVVQTGYQINGRLLRPARVIVAKAAE
ncbi:MAG: nucleotide exchange factor GrpE [Pseudomonadota bacterium]